MLYMHKLVSKEVRKLLFSVVKRESWNIMLSFCVAITILSTILLLE